jgi:glycine cleavage system aminomethyltransferase T
MNLDGKEIGEITSGTQSPSSGTHSLFDLLKQIYQ